MGRPLLSVHELEDMLRAPAHGALPSVLDVRWELATGAGRGDYERGHIPGAAFIDLDAQLASPPGGGGRHPLPAPDRFAADMRAAGVGNGRAVVVYDAATSMAAARAWWLLRYHGHGDVTVLDGGLAAWVAAGRSLEHHAPHIRPGDFVARPGKMPMVGADGAAELAARGVLLDARAPERFRGEVEPIDPIAGHIPGARNRPAVENIDSAGRFRDPTFLRAAFESVGVHRGVDVGAYCGSGVTAAHEVLALEIAGYRSALYPGSWSEWIEDGSRPVARA
jgi:thiosulfate/3-mercaptopyruvate sulfurtransferase